MPPNQSRDKGGRLKCGYSQGKQQQHCIDVAHVALGFSYTLPPCHFSNHAVAVCLSSEKCRAGSFCIFLHCALRLPRTFPLIRSFIRPFIHSFLHSFISSLTHSFAPSVVSSLWVPLWLRLCLFLCSSWLDFYFIFISISMKATCGRTLGHLSNFQSHIWRCHACVLFPAPHTHTDSPDSPRKECIEKAFLGLRDGADFFPHCVYISIKKGITKKLRRNAQRAKRKFLRKSAPDWGRIMSCNFGQKVKRR